MSTATNLKPATTYPDVLGAVLRHLRKTNGLEQQPVSEAAGVTQSTWSRIERGDTAITVDQLARAASCLNTKPEKILILVDQSVKAIQKQGVKVEVKRKTEGISPGLILIGVAALAALIAVIFSKAK